MPQVVMGDAISADFLTGPIERLLAFADVEYLCIEGLTRAFAADAFK
jgi:hypothetical protein